MPLKQQYVDKYHEQGYVVVDDAVDPDMMDELEAAGRRVRDKIRAGEVDVHSILGENREPQVIWGLIAPEFRESIFAEYLISEPVEAYTHAFLGQELRLGWAVIFCTGNQVPYDSTWHRDLGSADKGASAEEELALLNYSQYNLVKWHLALVDDPCFRVVPGSHRRYRTEAEREVLIERPRDPMPGERTIEVKRGQTVFWNGKTIHRGVTPEGLKERMSLHGGMAQYREDDPPEEKLDERFRWRLSPNLRENLPAKMQLYYDRWRALQPV